MILLCKSQKLGKGWGIRMVTVKSMEQVGTPRDLEAGGLEEMGWER